MDTSISCKSRKIVIQGENQIDKVAKKIEEETKEDIFYDLCLVPKDKDRTSLLFMNNYINKISNSTLVAYVVKIDFSGCKVLKEIFEDVMDMVSLWNSLKKLNLSNWDKPPSFILDILENIVNLKEITDLNLAEDYDKFYLAELIRQEKYIHRYVRKLKFLISFDLLNDWQRQTNLFPIIYKILQRNKPNKPNNPHITILNDNLNRTFQTQVTYDRNSINCKIFKLVLCLRLSLNLIYFKALLNLCDAYSTLFFLNYA